MIQEEKEGAAKQGKEAEPGTGFELVFECGGWGNAARGAMRWQGETSKRLVGYHPWQPALLWPQLQLGTFSPSILGEKMPFC